MNEIIERYEQTVQLLAQSLADNRTYEQRYQTTDVFEEIKQEEQDIHHIFQEIKARAIILRQLKQKQSTFILDHPNLPTLKIQELLPIAEHIETDSPFFSSFLQLNHSIQITLQIISIHHFLQNWGNIQNELLFDTFRLKLHHIDKLDSSRLMRYHPTRNMYHISHLINNTLIRNDRSVSLTLKHTIRNNNYALYGQLFKSSPVSLVAESNYGAILGTAEINFSEISPNKEIKRLPICLKLRRKYQQNQHVVEQPPVFYANCRLTVTLQPIAPELEQLTKNYESQLKQRTTSRSPSPNRIISTPSKSHPKSGKHKRQMMSKLVAGTGTIQLTIYECWEYKYQLHNINLQASRELVYKSLVNIKDRRIELVKYQDVYYFKLFVVKQMSRKPASIVFSFNSNQYHVHVLAHTLFQTIPLEPYKQLSKIDRKDTELVFKNTLIDLGCGNLIYAQQNNRIQQNLTKLQIQCGLLSTLFVRSILQECQIYANPPFKIVEIVKKQDGFMLTYRYQMDYPQKQENKLVIYLCSDTSNINEMHIYNCWVQARKVTHQTLYRGIYVAKGQVFSKLSLKMIANENYKYEIEASDVSKVRVVNGSDFSYRNGSNQDLVVQIVGDLPLLTDLIFRDNKNRSFFMKLAIKPQKQ